MDELHPKQVKKQLFWTNGCYRAALLEHYAPRLSKKDKRLNSISLQRHIKYYWKEEIAPEIRGLYMKNMLALSSKRLNIILQAFQSGQQWRKQETIDAIMTELMERSMENRNEEDA
jgi:hypothetical protein